MLFPAAFRSAPEFVAPVPTIVTLFATFTLLLKPNVAPELTVVEPLVAPRAWLWVTKRVPAPTEVEPV